MMGLRVKSYRNRHKRCLYCSFHDRSRPLLPSHIVQPNPYIGWCKIRMKFTNGKLPRWFCKEYEVREDE